VSKYKISRRIGRGGMAEVFLAVQEGLGGFEKLVVVKRIFPQFCEDEHFVSMFLQEARLAASIQHPNVVHINDIERDEDGYLLIMEYLSGESLAYVWEALRTRREQVPPGVACRVGASIAAGLHQAHIATDAAGHPQPIVHRDVTPSNLIVCYNGMVKVVDFGVAKATLSEGQTQAGALKGKMSYLSPEQIADQPIDGRADVFQLGICLHELLTGRRLFRGTGDHEKMKAVMETPILPPSQLNPAVPPAVDKVVLRALERDVTSRFQSADELRRALDRAALDSGFSLTDADVGEWMKESFPERHAERLALERECVAQVREGRSAAEIKSGLMVLSESSSRARGYRTPTMAAEQHTRPVMEPAGRRVAMWAGAAIAAFVILVSAIAAQSGGDGGSANLEAFSGVESPGEPTPLKFEEDLTGEPEPEIADPAPAPEPETAVVKKLEPEPAPAAEPTRQTVRITAIPETAEIEIDGKTRAVGAVEVEIDPDREHRLRVSAPGYETHEESFTDTPKSPIRLKPVSSQEAAGGGETVAAPAASDDGGGAAPPEKPRVRAPAVRAPVKSRDDRRPRRPRTDNRNPFASD
jgi:serine/threonine-protein kinase